MEVQKQFFHHSHFLVLVGPGDLQALFHEQHATYIIYIRQKLTILCTAK
jgi:hypothetical protein